MILVIGTIILKVVSTAVIFLKARLEQRITPANTSCPSASHFVSLASHKTSSMQRISFLLFAFVSLFLPDAHAQYESVFPGLDGPALIQALQENYTPDDVLPFGNSRDTLFSRVDAQNDNLTCVYTGYTIFLDPTQDPTVDAFSKGINTEHTYPRAFGAGEEPAVADMHHLFPTREDVNAARANLPFREIPDGQAQNWFYLAQQQSTIPTTNRDLYSEYSSTGFEPPEAHKGDVARAMFYFYTIYRIQANAEDPNFFAGQRETLCEWHIADPVDDKEYQRTRKIAFYQGNPNPFVLDCTLAERTYCSGLSVPCDPVAVDEVSKPGGLELAVSPNPARDEAILQYRLPVGGTVQLQLFDASGRRLVSESLGYQPAGMYSYPFPVKAFQSPFLAGQLMLAHDGGIIADAVKILVAGGE